MRGLIISMMLLAAISPAQSDDKDIDALIDALVHNMALSYFCRDAIGVASYQAARTGTADALMPYMGYAQAIVFVNDLDEKFKNDPRRFEKPDPGRCYELKGDAMHRIRLERARLQLAD